MCTYIAIYLTIKHRVIIMIQCFADFINYILFSMARGCHLADDFIVAIIAGLVIGSVPDILDAGGYEH